MYGVIDHPDSNFKQIHTAIYLVLANNPCRRRENGIIYPHVNMHRISAENVAFYIMRCAVIHIVIVPCCILV
jgi:galactose-1-phosphate uridylyltransferase